VSLYIITLEEPLPFSSLGILDSPFDIAPSDGSRTGTHNALLQGHKSENDVQGETRDPHRTTSIHY